jgi:hypothetical protein
MLVFLIFTVAILLALESNLQVFSQFMKQPDIVFLPTCIVFVLLSMFAKLYFLNHFRRDQAILLFVAMIGVFVPLLWLVSPDWDNPHVYPIANYVGLPIAVLAVPVASFFSCVATNEKPLLSVRDLAELLFIPIWFVGWIIFESFVLGWVWI